MGEYFHWLTLVVVYPEMISVAFPLSPGAGALEPKNARDFYEPRGLSSATDEDIINYVRTHSILRLIELLPETTKKSQ